MGAHVLVEDLSSLALDEGAAHHLTSVLRVRTGEPVGATDGRGGYVPCVFAGHAGHSGHAGRSGHSDRGVLEAVGEVVVAPPRSPQVTVGFVPVKGDRPEWAVQKLTELGVDRIVLLSSALAVVRWEGPRLRSHLARMERVARSAVMQSRQVWLPSVTGVVSVRDFLGTGDAAVAMADMSGGPMAPSVQSVAVGPEGGWSEAELALARARSGGSGGASVVSLGDTVLRAETAAVAAGVLLTARRAGLVS